MSYLILTQLVFFGLLDGIFYRKVEKQCDESSSCLGHANGNASDKCLRILL
jgi:hypothetical protein